MFCHPFSKEPKVAPKFWLIESIDHPGDFWSNEWGWASLDEATRFSDEDHDKVHLPVRGCWFNTLYLCPRCGEYWSVHNADGSCVDDEAIDDPNPYFDEPIPAPNEDITPEDPYVEAGCCIVCHAPLDINEKDICADCESGLTLPIEP